MAKSVRAKRPDAMYLGPVNCWKALGIGIVSQAVLDWREATVYLAKPITATKSQQMLEQKRSAEHFLSSADCEFYSGLDGPTLLKKLKEGKL